MKSYKDCRFAYFLDNTHQQKHVHSIISPQEKTPQVKKKKNKPFTPISSVQTAMEQTLILQLAFSS